MSTVRTEQLLARVREVVAGREQVERVIPLIETVHSATEQSWQKFLLESADDAEMPVETREKIAGALEEYLDCLGHMRQAAGAGDLELLGAMADQAQNHVQSLRAAQDEHRAALSSGPTPFPYLNLLLIQYGAIQEGASGARLLALLDESPSFLQWLRTELNVRGVSPEDSLVVYHLRQFLEALGDSIERGEGLPDIQDDISELALQLAGLLAEPRLASEDEGPTAVPAVNQVLEALSAWTGDKEEFQFLLSVINQARNSLRAILPISSPPDIVSRLDTVLGSLDRLEQCLLEQIGYDELVASATELETTTTELSAAVLSMGQSESSPYSEALQDLPLIFRSVLEPAFAFLDGQVDSNTVFAASDHLDESASQMLKQASEIPSGDDRLQSIQEALELMREAAELLRELAERGQPKLLEVATALCYQAADHLKAAGIG